MTFTQTGNPGPDWNPPFQFQPGPTVFRSGSGTPFGDRTVAPLLMISPE